MTFPVKPTKLKAEMFSPKASASASAVAKPVAKPAAKKGGGNGGGGANQDANNPRGAGRKQIDWQANVTEELVSFAATSSSAALWWGSGAQTKNTDLMKKRDMMKHRIRNCHDAAENDDLIKFVKTFSILIEMITANLKHFLQSNDFKVLLDTQISFCNLEPKVTIEWPTWMKRERQLQAICGESDPDKWHALVKTQALEGKGLSAEDVISEQNRIWNEKLAELLRENSMDSMNQYFLQHIA